MGAGLCCGSTMAILVAIIWRSGVIAPLSLLWRVCAGATFSPSLTMADYRIWDASDGYALLVGRLAHASGPGGGSPPQTASGSPPLPLQGKVIPPTPP